MFDSAQDFMTSAVNDEAPPAGLSPEAMAIWHARAGNWETSHDIAQDIDTKFGSWIHAHLHLIEGDLSNASYWYARAGRPAMTPKEIPDDWFALAKAAIAAAQ